MTNCSHSPAGALQRFECTGGRQFFFLFEVSRTALVLVGGPSPHHVNDRRVARSSGGVLPPPPPAQPRSAGRHKAVHPRGGLRPADRRAAVGAPPLVWARPVSVSARPSGGDFPRDISWCTDFRVPHGPEDNWEDPGSEPSAPPLPPPPPLPPTSGLPGGPDGGGSGSQRSRQSPGQPRRVTGRERLVGLVGWPQLEDPQNPLPPESDMRLDIWKLYLCAGLDYPIARSQPTQFYGVLCYVPSFSPEEATFNGSTDGRCWGNSSHELHARMRACLMGSAYVY